MILQGTKINYMPSKCHVIIIIINTPGQIVLIYFIAQHEIIMLWAANSIYSPDFAVWPMKNSISERAVCHLATCSDNNL